ncbi:Pre-mRNA-splicing factor SPF27 [Dermatophagoides farinae]|uniref:Pre-mRNA-splicing factor SPF27 n=1 Tax=Dermatophagoides farinae TaxID=6954 RepID=A0A922IED0_DERFA|nr:pre-mRNA-splicing factor SPF27-like [Dermatophagoides farinae]KAH7642595.1 bcas2-like protein [Dermatophagoides farinae]KAH9529909.1 Pre-mRNA-splicing factor SPF27 [Dermatophagoides farinae]
MYSDLVDALPYIDNEFNNSEVRLAVAQMVEDETKRYRPTKNYLESLPNLPTLDVNKFETDILRKEFERLNNGQSMEQLNMKRYELPSPSTGKLNDIWAWQECLENSFTQLEHQTIRIQNLELLTEYGTETSKMYNSIMTQLLARSKAHLEKIRKQIQDINLLRKNSQTQAGEQIKILEENWVSLVGKNYEIERACLQLETDLIKLQQQQKQNFQQKE